MGKITDEINSFLQTHKAQAIHPVPQPLPNQRGPTCGFYALAYVLTYWHDRLQLHGGTYATKQPLPPRTNLDRPKQVPGDKQARAKAASEGTYTSLRQFGKFNRLTVLGSVFDAQNLVKVAQGEKSQYAGQFDGKVVSVTADNFSARVKSLLEWECPVIVPYDVSVADATKGEPVYKRGEAAHWVTIIGHYTVGSDDYAVFFNWGAFFTAKMQAFAISNAQLTSNRYLTFAKYKVTDQHGNVYYSDYSRRKNARSRVKTWQEQLDRQSDPRKLKLDRPNGNRMHNPEFNDPTLGGTQPSLLDDKDGRSRIAVGGLRNKIVVVYRKEDATQITGVIG